MRGLGVGLGRREAVAERVHRLVEERNRTLHGVHLFTSSLLLLEGFAGAVVSRLAGVVSWRFVGKQLADLVDAVDAQLKNHSAWKFCFRVSFRVGDCSVSVTPGGGVTGVHNVTLSWEGSVT